MSKIVNLGGGMRHDPRVPNKCVIKALEDALEMARAGEMCGFSMAQVFFDDTSACVSVGMFPTRMMVGTLEEAKFRLLARECLET